MRTICGSLIVSLVILACARSGPHLTASSNSHVAGFDKVLPVFIKVCSRCHNANSGRGNWLDPNVAITFRNKIYDRVWLKQDMPPDGKISKSDRAAIAAWALGEAAAPEKLTGPGTNERNTPDWLNRSKNSRIDPRAGMMAWRGFDPVTRGAYMARAANCFSCHTSLTPDSPVGAGGRSIETAFGALVTPNITPDLETGIGRWTPEEFYRALHDGIRSDGELLYPVFPYTSYTKMTRADVGDIYAYLMSLRPVRNKVDVNHLSFPFKYRASLRLWRALYFTPGEFEPDPDTNAMWNRGKYLVTGPGHCGECHTPRNFMGALEHGKEFMGSEIDNWFASNMRYSVKNGIAQWTQAELVNFLGTGEAIGKATVVGPMAEVVFNSLQYLTLDDLKAMAYYLSVVSAPGYYDEKERRTEFSVETGEKLYVEHCAECHKLSGRGVLGEFPPFFQNPVVNQTSDNLIAVILLGVPPLANYDPMPSFSQKLSDEQIASIVNYIRVRWGSANQCEITAAHVAKKRAVLCPSL